MPKSSGVGVRGYTHCEMVENNALRVCTRRGALGRGLLEASAVARGGAITSWGASPIPPSSVSSSCRWWCSVLWSEHGPVRDRNEVTGTRTHVVRHWFRNQSVGLI